MEIMTDRTTISITTETKNSLDFLGYKGEDYDDIIKRNINFTKKFNNEREFHLWFKENYFLFGFESIDQESVKKFPDFVLIKNGKKVRVELETLSSRFIAHGHDPSNVDLVICLVKDKELEVEVVEITPFVFDDSGNYIIRRCSPITQRKFKIYRRFLSIIKNNGSSNTQRQLSNTEVLDFLISNSPIDKEIEKFMKIEEENMNTIVNDIKDAKKLITGESI